ncbi:hypothetical protein EMPG_17892 [Blastomyces silverae]|uniref:Uncharacterized protein n=1 Tax=Blastomyces silverae TaxID=2060906 RepID=A0A0H1BBJ0_9EURO|nr:hypothetical protein EMPG_17892 [Blastomyces silverae]
MQILSIFLAATATYFTITQAAATGMMIADAAAKCGPKGCHDCDPGCKTAPFKCPPGQAYYRISIIDTCGRLYTEAIPSPPILVGHAAGLDESKRPRSDPRARTNIELRLEGFTKKFRKKPSIPINAFLIWARLGTTKSEDIPQYQSVRWVVQQAHELNLDQKAVIRWERTPSAFGRHHAVGQYTIIIGDLGSRGSE